MNLTLFYYYGVSVSNLIRSHVGFSQKLKIILPFQTRT
ncbi:unnamed protein product [Brassica oleracea]